MLNGISVVLVLPRDRSFTGAIWWCCVLRYGASDGFDSLDHVAALVSVGCIWVIGLVVGRRDQEDVDSLLLSEESGVLRLVGTFWSLLVNCCLSCGGLRAGNSSGRLSSTCNDDKALPRAPVWSQSNASSQQPFRTSTRFFHFPLYQRHPLHG